MLVTVSITAYNHEKYISHAIESVLMQETNFDYEILIGEDDSTDKTRKIVLEYQKKYPDKIRVLLNSRENVIYVNGKPSGMWNFMNNIKESKGKYIAFLDGDDYWTNPLKLQKQVDFLEKNPDFTICFHNVQIIHESKNKEDSLVIKSKNFPSEIDMLYLMEYGNPISKGACIFFNRPNIYFPDWFKKAPIADYPFYLINAKHGKIKYLNEVMSVYRKNEGGMWSKYGLTKMFELTLQVFHFLAENFDVEYAPFFKKHIYVRYFKLAYCYLFINKDIVQAAKYGIKALIHLPALIIALITIQFKKRN